MIRFAGYFAVLLLTAIFAVLDQPRARLALGGLILSVGLGAALLDFGLRKEAMRFSIAVVWALRVSTFAAGCYMLLLAYPVIAFLAFDRFRTDPPTPLAEQGPDTNYARVGMMTLGPRDRDVFDHLYYFWSPGRSGSTDAYLRFDYQDVALLRRAIPESKLKLAAGMDCAPPATDSSRPPWFIPPGTIVGPTYVWRSPHGRICFDEQDHHVFIRMVR